MNQEYIYRKGSVKDIPQLQTLGLLSYGAYEQVLGEAAWAKMGYTCGSESTYTDLIKIAQSFVCELNGQIIGMAFLIPQGNPMGFFKTEWAYIRLIGVAPDYRGKGIGKKLTRICIEFAKQSGEKIIALHTSEFQFPANYIYESLGFKKLKELEPIYNKKYFLYTMNLS